MLFIITNKVHLLNQAISDQSESGPATLTSAKQDPGIYAWSLDLRIQFFVRTGVAIFVRISPRFPKISKKLSGFSTQLFFGPNFVRISRSGPKKALELRPAQKKSTSDLLDNPRAKNKSIKWVQLDFLIKMSHSIDKMFLKNQISQSPISFSRFPPRFLNNLIAALSCVSLFWKLRKRVRSCGESSIDRP